MEPMRSMKSKLAQLEARLQTLIEGSAARLFPFDSNQTDLAHRLIAAMQAGIKAGQDGQLVAPNLFTLIVPLAQVEALRDHPELLEALTHTLEEVGTEAGLSFLSPPVLRIAEQSEASTQAIQVQAQISAEKLAQTSDLEVEVDGNSFVIQTNAFLIVNGTQVFPLSQSVINIGRRPDNQLVIDDPRISRIHAQLRAIKGRFVIFDLDSTGGTFVNDHRVSQSVLFPGDVISLSGIPLVFGQDPSGIGATQEYDSFFDE